MSNVTTVGIDLAKNVFSLHGVDERGQVVLRKTVKRARLLALVAQLPAGSARSPPRPSWQPWGTAREFRNGRQFAAWLGLVPRQYSTGGKVRLGHITKRGDPYVRTLLVMGARSVLQRAARERDPLSRWALALKERRGYHRACVAVAAKNARIVWALLAKESPLAA